MIDWSLLKLRFERYYNYKSNHATDSSINKVNSISLKLIDTPPLTPLPSPTIKKFRWNEEVSVELIPTKEELKKARTEDGTDSLATLIWDSHPTEGKSPVEISELNAMRALVSTKVKAAIAAKQLIEETDFGSIPITKTPYKHSKDHIFKVCI